MFSSTCYRMSLYRCSNIVALSLRSLQMKKESTDSVISLEGQTDLFTRRALQRPRISRDCKPRPLTTTSSESSPRQMDLTGRMHNFRQTRMYIRRLEEHGPVTSDESSLGQTKRHVNRFYSAMLLNLEEK